MRKIYMAQAQMDEKSLEGGAVRRGGKQRQQESEREADPSCETVISTAFSCCK